MLLPVILIKAADDDSLTGGGMDKLTVFQVNAYVGGLFLLSSVVKEDKVAFAEFSFLHFLAILLPLVIGVSFEVLVIYLAINSRGQSRAIHSSFGGATSSIRYAYPVC